MSDTFLFQSSINKFQLLIFAVSISDARQYAKNTHPNFDMRFVCKNPSDVSPYTLCATTENQVRSNRESLEKLLQGE